MMKKSLIGGWLALCLTLPLQVFAGADDYIGDSAIYTGDPVTQRPNVLIIIDNSKATLESAVGAAYDPTKTYDGSRNPWDIYETNQAGVFDTVAVENDTTDFENLTCTAGVVTEELLGTGTYAADGSAARPIIKANKDECETASKGSMYALGNYLNYTEYDPGDKIVIGTDDNDYRLIATHTASDSNRPPSGASWASYWEATGTSGQGESWTSGSTYEFYGEVMTQRELVYNAVAAVLKDARVNVNIGAAVYGDNNKGAEVIYGMSNLSDSLDADGNLVQNANWANFLAVLPGSGDASSAPAITAGPQRPQSEALYDAGHYFGASYTAISETSTVPEDIENPCGNNHIIFITNGLSNAEGDPKLEDNIGNYDESAVVTYKNVAYADVVDEGDYGLGVHYLDDVAKKLKDDNIATTNMVLAFQNQDPLIIRAAEEGGGEFYNVFNSGELEKALRDLIVNLVLQADTSFVAPVVPASTTNRTISSNRVYLGLFKPMKQQPWLGNLKKYGVDSNNRLIDRNGDPATTDAGEFIATSLSYWGTDDSNQLMTIDGAVAESTGDGGIITAGGAGGSLLARSTTRNIYTYLGSNVDLTHSSNAFNSTNLTAGLMAMADDTERNALITYIYGGTGSTDVFDADEDENTTEERPWLLGDILHSKPLVLHFSGAAISDESDCDQNKSMLFVGANDGMLHAFKDCDGSEAWAFIPDNLLSDLQYLNDQAHNYYVDSSSTAYVHDKNGDGTIDPTEDKVVIIFGQRRGGGKDTLASGNARGAYYALDVTVPTTPKFLWKINNLTLDGNGAAVFSELGEPWSQPRLAKVKVGAAVKVVAFIGGGYDTNEDLRFGNTRSFPFSTDNTTDTTVVSYDSGVVTSSHGDWQYNPSGRGLFAVEVAELVRDADNKYDADIASHGGELVWKYTHAEDSYLVYSIPSDLSVHDMNADSYQDRIYVGDTGGRVWRFDVGNSDTANWTGRIIFRANRDGDTSWGRKFFYKPAVSIESGQATLFIGSGDREHPINRGVVDRMYSIKDKGQTSVLQIDEADMQDLTDNELQDNATTADEIEAILNALKSSTNYGWYIKLNQNSGEKVLAPAEVFNKNVFFTTYAPDTVDLDPCEPGNLGTSRLYHLDAETAEAVYNYDVSNDDSDTSGNTRASNDEGYVLRRTDRVKTIGEGIPSGIVTLIDASGKVTMMISSSNRVSTYSAPDARLISPVYWMQW